MRNIFYISLFIVALSIGYYFVVFVPKIEGEKIELKKTEIEQKRINQNLFNECIDQVNANFQEVLKEMGNKVVVTKENWKIMQDMIKEQKEDCFKKYSQK